MSAIARNRMKNWEVIIKTDIAERSADARERLLKIPYYDCLTPALLRLDPQWDPLRSDPAFQKLCEEKQK